jgi:hypothetical protein
MHHRVTLLISVDISPKPIDWRVLPLPECCNFTEISAVTSKGCRTTQCQIKEGKQNVGTLPLYTSRVAFLTQIRTVTESSKAIPALGDLPLGSYARGRGHAGVTRRKRFEHSPSEFLLEVRERLADSDTP